MKNYAFCRAVGLNITIDPDEILFKPMSSYKDSDGDVIVLYGNVDVIKADVAFRLNGVWYLRRHDVLTLDPICWAPVCSIATCDMVPFIKAS